MLEVSRLTDEWPEGQNYRATVRNFGGNVELSVRCVPPDEKIRRCQTTLPVHLALPKRRTEEERAARAEENGRRAQRRACQGVRWSLKAMRADHLLTLTYRENVEDLARVQRDWQAFTRLVRMRYPDIRYVAVREKQERGAVHLHVALHGRGDVHWLRRCWWLALGHRARFEDLPEGKRRLVAMVKDGREWRDARPEEVRGNIDLRGPSKKWGGSGVSWKVEKLAAYLTKYMKKAFGEIASGRRYWPSKNIEKPEPVKFWLAASEFVEAVREAHDLMRGRFGIAELTIWHSPDWLRLWLSGSGVLVPF